MMIDDLKARFPNLDNTLIDTYFPIYEEVYKNYYNADYNITKLDDEIILNLLAHLILSTDNNSNGENVKTVNSESVGGVSVSYTTNQNNNTETTFFNSTIYGQTFILLTSRRKGTYFV